MTQGERAKQFMPFDAMKGLKEALAEREERHLRVKKRELAEETIEQINRQLKKMRNGDEVEILFFKANRELTIIGTVTRFDCIFKYINVGNERIDFDDIYSIKRI